jgi:hypothetical protein
MPRPHGIGDCSRIRHLRTTFLSQSTERQKPFIVGGLDSERPPTPQIDFPLATRTFFRVLSVEVRSPWHIWGEAWAACRRRQPRNLLPIIRVRNRSRQRHQQQTGQQQGRGVAKSGPTFSSPIPLTFVLYL